MIHALVSAVFCSIMFLFQDFILDFHRMVYFLPAAFYIGREFTQAEYRYISTYCNGKRANMPWYAPFEPTAWTIKSLLDFLLPTVVCSLFYFFA